MTLPPQDDDVIHLGGRGACPDCKQGKHAACVGDSWDLEADKPLICSCFVEGHGARRRTFWEEGADREEEAHYRHTRIGGADL